MTDILTYEVSTIRGQGHFDRRKTPARPRWKRCAASSDACPTSSTGNYSPTCSHQQGRAREGTRARHSHPAWPTHIPTSTLRISHFPDPSPPSLGPHPSPRLDIEGSQYSAFRGAGAVRFSVTKYR